MNRFAIAFPLLAVLVLLAGIIAVSAEGLSSDANGSEAYQDTPCILCPDDPGVPVVRVTEAWLDSIAECDSRFNIAQIARIDSLYRAGKFGPVGGKQSIQRAHLLARLTTINVYTDLVRIACDDTRVYEANGKALEGFVAKYSDAVLFGAMRIDRLRMGLGHVCVRYDLDEKTAGENWQGGELLRWRVKDTKIEGQKRRVLSIDVPTGDHDVVEGILTRHHHFKVEHHHLDGPPAPYDWVLVYDLEGAWVRKRGLHKPSAYMFWVSSRGETVGSPNPSATPGDTLDARAAVQLPPVPLVGTKMYIRGLRFRLPSVLPDINLDDLRTLKLAMPILDMNYLREGKQPAWLGSDIDFTFADWEGYGEVPPGIRERFPDR